MNIISIGPLLFSFRGCIGRNQLWAGMAINFLVIFLSVLLASLIDTRLIDPAIPFLSFTPNAFATAAYFGGLAAFAISSSALSIKRCRDRGKSEFTVLLSLVPFVGAVFWLVEFGLRRSRE